MVEVNGELLKILIEVLSEFLLQTITGNEKKKIIKKKLGKTSKSEKADNFCVYPYLTMLCGSVGVGGKREKDKGRGDWSWIVVVLRGNTCKTITRQRKAKLKT